MFLSLVLTTNEQRKLNIFRFIQTLPIKRYNVKYLSDNLEIPYSSMTVLLSEIEGDLQQILGADFTLFDTQGYLYLDERFPNDDAYFAFLIEHSIPYQALIFLLQYPDKNLDNFCRSLYISKASVMRRLQPLAEYAKQFDLVFNRSKLDLKGDERLIRIFLFNLIWTSSCGKKLPFHNLSPDLLEQALTSLEHGLPAAASYVGKQETVLFAEITIQRIQAGHYVVDDEYYAAAFPKQLALRLDLLDKFLPAADPHYSAELRFIQFMTFFSPSYQYPDDPRITSGDCFQQESVLTELLTDFAVYFQKEVSSDQTDILQDGVVFGNLFNVLFSYYVFRKKIPTLFELLDFFRQSDSVHYQLLQQKLALFFRHYSRRKNYKWLKQCQSELTALFTWLLIDTFEKSEADHLLRVALVIEPNYLFTRDIMRFLEDLSFVELVPFIETNKADYDLLICSSSILLPDGLQALPTYRFNFFSGKNNYFDLYRMLKRVYREKNAALNEGVQTIKKVL